MSNRLLQTLSRKNLQRRLQSCWQSHGDILFLLAITVLSTVAPHPDNITPIGALGLFAGAYMSQRRYLLLPVVAALLADLASVGVYNLLIMVFVYAGHLAAAWCGRLLVDSHRLLGRLPLGVVAASVSFYLLSNLGNWWVFLPHTAAGLWENYVAGLPYLLRTLLGNTLYSLLFFGCYELMKHYQPREQSLVH
ncbi:MAG: DUF6580 family putative transport protein [Pseudomonadales bacterium]|nr:DUF6580 family putative transport protein [Pseudomonadales bacterium]